MSALPQLEIEIIKILNDLLTKNLGPTLSYLDQFFLIEKGHINCRHPDFVIKATEAIKEEKSDTSRMADMSMIESKAHKPI